MDSEQFITPVIPEQVQSFMSPNMGSFLQLSSAKGQRKRGSQHVEMHEVEHYPRAKLRTNLLTGIEGTVLLNVLGNILIFLIRKIKQMPPSLLIFILCP